MTVNESTTAACLTAPGSGGVALIRVSGPHAAALVTPHLQSRRPLDLQALPADELRLCRFIDHDETIDDTLVCARRDPVTGHPLIDLNVHGGPRIVQRILMALQRDGAVIPDARVRRDDDWPARDRIENEALSLLPSIRTRAVVVWLLATSEKLSAAIRQSLEMLQEYDAPAASRLLCPLILHRDPTRLLLGGARVVVVGRPNAGKSTLVNLLARREQIIVSDVPGTTRDYVEQAASVDGIPITLVDTAGIHETADPIEREAISRIITAPIRIRKVDIRHTR